MAVEISPCEVEINEMELTEDKVCLKIKLKIKCCRIKFYFSLFFTLFYSFTGICKDTSSGKLFYSR